MILLPFAKDHLVIKTTLICGLFREVPLTLCRWLTNIPCGWLTNIPCGWLTNIPCGWLTNVPDLAGIRTLAERSVLCIHTNLVRLGTLHCIAVVWGQRYQHGVISWDIRHYQALGCNISQNLQSRWDSPRVLLSMSDVAFHRIRNNVRADLSVPTGPCHHDGCRWPGAYWRQAISNHHADLTATTVEHGISRNIRVPTKISEKSSMTFPENFSFPGFPGFPDPVGTMNISRCSHSTNYVLVRSEIRHHVGFFDTNGPAFCHSDSSWWILSF